jgi:hypothetical protein
MHVTAMALFAIDGAIVQPRNPELSVTRRAGFEAVTVEADRFAANVLPIIKEAHKTGQNPQIHRSGAQCARRGDSSRWTMAREVNCQHLGLDLIS